MVKKLLLSAGLAVTLGACANNPSAPATSSAATRRVPPPGCVSSTATRLPPDHYCAGFGNTYTQGDLSRTGQAEVGDALRMLDPSITVHGGP